MTGKCNINIVEEIINSIELLAEEENKIKENDENSDDGNMCKDEVENNKKNLEIIEDIDNIMKEDDFNEIDKGLGNIDILSFENSSDKNLSIKNLVEPNESKDKAIKNDINEINEERDYLNLFCLNFDCNYQSIKSVLIKIIRLR